MTYGIIMMCFLSDNTLWYMVPAVDGDEGLGNRASSTQGKSVLISLAGCKKDYINTILAYNILSVTNDT